MHVFRLHPTKNPRLIAISLSLRTVGQYAVFKNRAPEAPSWQQIEPHSPPDNRQKIAASQLGMLIVKT